MSYALFNAGLDVRSARSLPEMCEHIQKFTRENNDKIIMGFGASTHCVEENRLISMLACPPRRGCKSAPSSASRSPCNPPF
jgi:hypothetical protein